MSECPLEWIVLAALHLWQQQSQIQQARVISPTASSPWLLEDGWRLNAPPSNHFSLWDENQKFDVHFHRRNDFIEAELNKKFYFIQVKEQRDDFIYAVVNNNPYQLTISDNKSQIQLQNEHKQLVLWTSSPYLSSTLL